VNVEIQKTSSDVNREFRGAPTSINSTRYGGTVTVGYQHNICGNFSIGIEVGADFGSGAKRMPIGGVLRNDSAVAMSAGDDYYKRRGILQQVLQNVSDAIGNRGVPFRQHTIVSGQAWQDLLRTFRYWGGAANSANVPIDAANLPDGNLRAFILNNRTVVNNGGVYDQNQYMIQVANADVTREAITGNPVNLVHFMPHALQNITQLGDSISGGRDHDRNTLVGMRVMREFVHERFSDVERIFGNIAANPITNIGGAVLLNPNVDFGNPAPAGLTDSGGARTVRDVLGGYFDGVASLDDLGIPIGVLPGATPNDQFNTLQAAIDSVYDPLADAVNFALPAGVTEASIKNSLHMKTSFNICPHVAFKFGYFFNEFRTYLYAKICGIILNGRVVPASNLYDVKEESFRKLAPLLAIGATKNITNNWSVSLEFSQAFRIKKQLQDINAIGHRIRNDINISKCDIKILLTFRF
jgi:hypothetical protein